MLETNLSANDIAAKIRHVLDLCSVDYENIVITYRKKEKETFEQVHQRKSFENDAICGDNPKFCVIAKSGANREKFIMGGRRVKRLPPC